VKPADYEEIYKNWWTFPDCRIHLSLEGEGEGMWGKELPGGLFGINNEPVSDRYMWQDIVRTKEVRNMLALVHRRWAIKVYFTWDEPEDEKSALPLRKRIHEALQAQGTAPGFMWKNLAYTHFRADVGQAAAFATIQESLREICIVAPA